MRKGLAYLDAAETFRQVACRVTDPRAKKQLNDMALEWETLAAERAKQLAKESATKRPSINE
jgi:hypothetical protein